MHPAFALRFFHHFQSSCFSEYVMLVRRNLIRWKIISSFWFITCLNSLKIESVSRLNASDKLEFVITSARETVECSGLKGGRLLIILHEETKARNLNYQQHVLLVELWRHSSSKCVIRIDFATGVWLRTSNSWESMQLWLLIILLTLI